MSRNVFTSIIVKRIKKKSKETIQIFTEPKADKYPYDGKLDYIISYSNELYIVFQKHRVLNKKKTSPTGLLWCNLIKLKNMQKETV